MATFFKPDSLKIKFKDYHLVLIPIPKELNELREYLDTHNEQVECPNWDQPTVYLNQGKPILALNVYFKDETEAAVFYLKWSGFATTYN